MRMGGGLVPVHDPQHLLADVLAAAQRARLDEVLVAPGVGELVVLPGVVDGQQREVVPLQLKELGFLLVGLRLLVLLGETRGSYTDPAEGPSQVDH